MIHAFVIQAAYTLYVFIFAFVHDKWIEKGIRPPKKGKAVNLWTKFWLACATAFGFSIWFFGGNVPYPWGILTVVGIVIFELGYLWCFFDLFLNLLRGLGIAYISCDNGKALDEWFCGRFWLQLLVKIVIMVLGASTIYLSFKLM